MALYVHSRRKSNRLLSLIIHTHHCITPTVGCPHRHLPDVPHGAHTHRLAMGKLYSGVERQAPGVHVESPSTACFGHLNGKYIQ